MTALDLAITSVGGVTKLAGAIGVVQGAVSNWRMRGVEPPPEHCAAIEAATDRAVRRWQLRPTDWHRIWPELIATEGAPPVPAEAAAAEVVHG